MILRLFLLMVVSMSMLGCATGYHANKWNGGYTDRRVGENKYLISFNGNGYTNPQLAQDYALRRAQEICEAQGYDSFELLSAGGYASTSTTPVSTYCNGSSYGGQFNANCQSSGGNVINKPTAQVLVSCSGNNISRKTAAKQSEFQGPMSLIGKDFLIENPVVVEPTGNLRL